MGAVRAASRLVPLFVARRCAAAPAAAPSRAKPLKLAEERAIRPEAVDALLRASDASLVVCGHAHEPRDEILASGARWIVVGAFGEGRGGEILELHAGGVTARDQG